MARFLNWRIGEFFWEFKTPQLKLTHMHAFDTAHSDCQILIMLIPNESHLAKFNANHQSYPEARFNCQ